MTGTLGLFSLVDLFQLVASSSRTGRLTVEHPRGPARVYFDKGRVVHADFAGARGEEAVYRLFGDEQGRFEFKLGISAPETTIRRSTENLVIEAVRLLDESRREDAAPPLGDEAVLAFKEAAAAGGQPGSPQSSLQNSLQSFEARILHLVDGRRSVAQIASESRLPLDEVQDVLSRFLAKGELELKTHSGTLKPRTVRLLAGLARVPLPPHTVGLAPNLLAEWNRAVGTEVEAVVCRHPDGRVMAFDVEGVMAAGSYILFSRDTLLSSDLAANTELLVKPYLP